MAAPREPERASDLVLLGFGVAAFLLASPLRELWARDGAPWWTPFAVWGAVIAMAFGLARLWAKHGE